MRVVKEHERLIVKVMAEIETAKAKDGKTIYQSVRRAADAFGEDPDNLPEDMLDGMYAAITEMAEDRFKGLCKDGSRLLHAAFAAVAALPEEPSPEQIKKVQKQCDTAMLPLAFMASVLKTITDDMDYEYLGEQMLEAGRAAVKKAEQPDAACQPEST